MANDESNGRRVGAPTETMTAQIKRRVDALEGQHTGVCLACELAQLNGAPRAPCTHRIRSLAEELEDLNKLEQDHEND
jgi:hypothetical protein